MHVGQRDAETRAQNTFPGLLDMELKASAMRYGVLISIDIKVEVDA